MRGMSEAVWELGKCHSPTVGVAKEDGEIAQHSLSSACALGRHSALKSPREDKQVLQQSLWSHLTGTTVIY